MSQTKRLAITSRKEPQQQRSAALVKAILEAAQDVMVKEGATRFTTARVAERAGVSVGSVYQYFPNKAAILFRLQADEWVQTANMLKSILEQTDVDPFQRLRDLVLAFMRSECEEAEVRGALSDAAPLYRDSPEAKEAKAACDAVVVNFMHEVAPLADNKQKAMASEVIFSSMSALGHSFSQIARTNEEICEYSATVADMYCAYLSSLR